MNLQDPQHREAFAALRKEFKLRVRDRSGKVYLTLYWNANDPSLGYAQYRRAEDLVCQLFPGAYVTSACTRCDATFRLNP